jgi:hypothetical protein
VEWTNRVGPGQFERTTGRSLVETAIPHCTLLERFTATVRGHPFWATILLTVAASDTVRRVWIDSEHGEPLLFAGRWDGDTLRLEWARDLEDRQLRLLHLYFAITPDSFRTVTYLSPSASTAWELVAEATYHREHTP